MFESFGEYLSQRKAVEEDYRGIKYIRFVDDARPYKRGTVVFDNGKIVPAYPKIGRLFILEEGLKKFFREPFYIEEKADGYNVRVTHHEGNPVAVTRGGFICPFSTDRLMDFYDFKGFFRQFPEYILFGEIVGPNNPYMELHPPYIEFDIGFRLFDIFDLKEFRYFLPQERYEFADKYQIPQVEKYGIYTSEEFERIKSLVLELNNRGIEGIVFKSSEKNQKYYKYATPEINIKDIEVDIDLLLELPAEFFIQRIVRYVLSSSELNYQKNSDAERTGKILIKGFAEVVEEFQRKGSISRQYVLYFNHPENVEEFIKLENRASSLIKTRLISIEKEGSKFKVTLEKTFLKATTRLSRLTRGFPLYD